MKRSNIVILSVIFSAFLISACCGMPKRSVSTVSNAGFLKIVANPDDADVYIDGTLVGKAREFDGRKQVLQLESGRHKIEIKKDGYHSYSRDTMVGAGATDEFKVTLSEK